MGNFKTDGDVSRKTPFFAGKAHQIMVRSEVTSATQRMSL